MNEFTAAASRAPDDAETAYTLLPRERTCSTAGVKSPSAGEQVGVVEVVTFSQDHQVHGEHHVDCLLHEDGGLLLPPRQPHQVLEYPEIDLRSQIGEIGPQIACGRVCRRPRFQPAEVGADTRLRLELRQKATLAGVERDIPALEARGRCSTACRSTGAARPASERVFDSRLDRGPPNRDP